MKKFIQNNQKKLIAIFSALLMIIFMLPSNRGANTRQLSAVGTIGGAKVYGTDFQQANEDWDTLARIPWEDQYGRNLTKQLQPEAYVAIEANKSTFYLLDYEARQQGIEISPDKANEFLVNNKVTLPSDPAEQQAVSQALARLMRVQALVGRAASAVKVSQPQVQRALATDQQQVWLNVAEFPTDNFHPTTAPTTQEVDDQYKHFVSYQPGQYNSQAGDPFGFGYTHPDRVKYQYIEIPKAQIIEAVKAQQPPIQWAADEITYRHAHPDEFPPPATQPAVAGSTTAPATQAARASMHPFDPENIAVFNALSRDKVDALTKQIQARIINSMSTDYTKWQKDRKIDPTADPLTSFGVPYDSSEYLKGLRSAIEKDTPNFTATVGILSDFWKTQADLEAEPGIGHSWTSSMGVSFPTYVMTSAAPFVSTDAQSATVLQVMAPSMPLVDADGNLYVCRITDADKAAQEPESAKMDQIVQDVQTVKSMDMARTAAQALASAATGSGSLPAAAADQGCKLLVAGPVVPTPTATIANYPLKPESSRILIESIRSMLLSARMSSSTMPVAVVDLPPDHKVVVIQIDTVVPSWTSDTFGPDTAYEQAVIYEDALKPFLLQWCNYDAVSKRLDYHPLNGQ